MQRNRPPALRQAVSGAENGVRMADSLIKTIENLIAYPNEEEWFEFKVDWQEYHALGEYISAMSNAAALLGREQAYFVWGIENNSHQVVGTKFNFQQEVRNEPLQHLLARMVRPYIGFQFSELTLRGKRIVVLSIPAARHTPTSFDKVRYMRISSSKVNLMDFPEREAQLFSVLRDGLPTITNTESEYQDLTFGKLFVYYEAKGIPLNRRFFKENLGFTTKDGKYNLLAQLMSDNSRLPIRFSLFSGKTKGSSLYSVREFGHTCLLYSLDDILNYGRILNVPQADERERIVERKEVLLFDNDVFREAVINAFVHNKWIDGNAPMFTGYQDRIEILSRGSLPPQQTLEGFYAGASVPVNQKLSDMILQLHISERSGRGVPKIVEVYGKESILLAAGTIQVTIPFQNLHAQASARDAANRTATTGEKEERNSLSDRPSSTSVGDKITPVSAEMTPVGGEMTPVVPPDASNEEKILAFCVQPRGILEIAKYLGYAEKKTVRRYLNPLLSMGRVARTIPDKPNSKLQKYITIK